MSFPLFGEVGTHKTVNACDEYSFHELIYNPIFLILSFFIDDVTFVVMNR